MHYQQNLQVATALTGRIPPPSYDRRFQQKLDGMGWHLASGMLVEADITAITDVVGGVTAIVCRRIMRGSSLTRSMLM